MTRLRLLEIIKWICFGALAAFLIVQAAGSRASSAPMAAVEKAVLAKADESKMKKADELMIRRLYGIDPSGYRSVRLYYPDTNMGAEELFLARMKDRSQKDALIGAIRARGVAGEEFLRIRNRADGNAAEKRHRGKRRVRPVRFRIETAGSEARI